MIEADVLAGGDYGDPANALGPPSRTVPGWLDIPPTTVNPASPAWGPGRLVTLESATDAVGARGSITVEFDHDVVDDPRNPFGLDFIVFGNAMHTIGGSAYFDGVSDQDRACMAITGTKELAPNWALHLKQRIIDFPEAPHFLSFIRAGFESVYGYIPTYL